MRPLGTMRVNDMGNLEIGGCDAVNLAKKYGTPLYVMDQTTIEDSCRNYMTTFSHPKIETEVIYASKAFLTLAMCRLIRDEGLSLDVVSGGELYTAMKAEYPAEKIYFHGNNKTVDEMIMALNYGVRRIVIDNETEIEMLEYLCSELDRSVEVLIRLNPGIEAHTHEYIQTANNDSKFGISIHSDHICTVVNRLTDSYYIDLKGFHYHIGSQILDAESFTRAIDTMMDFLDKTRSECGYTALELNLGGGFGIYYSEEDTPLDVDGTMKQIFKTVLTKSKEIKFPVPKLLIEPGRAIVGNAGTTLYKVGGIKETYGGRVFVFVDGGMADNPRTALYGSIYEAALANKMPIEPSVKYTVAGKCCESGDILIKDILLPPAERDDILAIASTGAYNYSMASNYNRLRKPAVVFVKDGNSMLVVKRETYEDILRNDV